MRAVTSATEQLPCAAMNYAHRSVGLAVRPRGRRDAAQQASKFCSLGLVEPGEEPLLGLVAGSPRAP